MKCCFVAVFPRRVGLCKTKVCKTGYGIMKVDVTGLSLECPLMDGKYRS